MRACSLAGATKSFLRRTMLPVLITAGLQPACDLATPPPTGVVLPGGLEGRDGLPTRLAAAIGEFAVAYGGNANEDGFILVSGLMADELQQTIGTSFNVDVDQRAAASSNPLIEAVYRDVQRARASAEQALAGYRDLDPTALGRLYAGNLVGFSDILLAEGFCGGIPFSDVAPDGKISYGSAESTAQVLDRAMAAFDSVLSRVPFISSQSQSGRDSLSAQVDIARLGRARSLLDLDRFEEAGAEAAQVPESFSWRVEYSNSTSREVNGVNWHTWSTQEYTAADSEGINGIGFLESGDPRSQVDTVAPGLYAPLDYSTPSDPIVLADVREARLIQAEALLRTGNASGSLDILNTLRASIGLLPLDDPGTPDGRVTQLFRERAFWLWLTGHRLGDLRRLIRQHGRMSDSVYPTGTYSDGHGKYGNQLDLPVYEVNNPRYDVKTCNPDLP